MSNGGFWNCDSAVWKVLPIIRFQDEQIVYKLARYVRCGIINYFLNEELSKLIAF